MRPHLERRGIVRHRNNLPAMWYRRGQASLQPPGWDHDYPCVGISSCTDVRSRQNEYGGQLGVARRARAVVVLDEFIHQPRVAYFSMEIALRSEIPTYAGGLGILAGDTLRSATDLGLPMVAVSLVSRAGYLRQEIDGSGRQIEHAVFWDPEKWATQLAAKVAITLERRTVWVGAWLYVLEGQVGGRQPVLLLDTDLPENADGDRQITHYLYGGDDAYRLKQQIVLGVGGVRLLRAAGFSIRQYHLNEGHSALLGLELLRGNRHSAASAQGDESVCDISLVREVCCFTTHTPVETAHDRFDYGLVSRVAGDMLDPVVLRQLAGTDALNMTRLALNLSDYVNGVAKRHAEVSARLFPGYRMHAITNGVHPQTWTAASYARLYDQHLPGWRHEPELLRRVDCCIPDALIWNAHLEAKQALVTEVQRLTGIALDPRVAILAFARRMTSYKRPDLLFTDIDRLKAIARGKAFQIVLAGKAHPRDAGGKQLIELLHAQARALGGAIPTVYLPDYDMRLSGFLTAGADVWLNTPLPPLEASGTSGMKAAFNGVPSLSVLDGWWIEGCIEGVTGWAIGGDERAGADSRALYDKLEQVVLPLYHGADGPSEGWIRVMKGAISKNAAYFNSHRMMRRYATEAYVR
jgi:glycogen phosphorylase